MYELALSEGLSGEILEEMKVIRRLFQENPDYVASSFRTFHSGERADRSHRNRFRKAGGKISGQFYKASL